MNQLAYGCTAWSPSVGGKLVEAIALASGPGVHAAAALSSARDEDDASRITGR